MHETRQEEKKALSPRVSGFGVHIVFAQLPSDRINSSCDESSAQATNTYRVLCISFGGDSVPKGQLLGPYSSPLLFSRMVCFVPAVAVDRSYVQQLGTRDNAVDSLSRPICLGGTEVRCMSLA